MGGSPRNPAPRNHLLAWIVKPSGCHCTDAFGGKRYRRVPTPLRSTSPFSDREIESMYQIVIAVNKLSCCNTYHLN